MARLVDQQYELVDVDTLTQHPANPNRGRLDAIGSSVAAQGFYGAVVVQRSTRRILAGNHRWQAARDAGLGQVPAIFVDVDDETATRIMLADNRTTRLGVDDESQLAELLEQLAASSSGLEGLGYSDDDMVALLESLGRDVDVKAHQRHLCDPDATPPDPPKEPVSKLGDVWILGEHRLACGNCSDEQIVTAAMAGQRAVLMATDPPYQIGYDAQNHPPSNANGGAPNRNKEWVAYQETSEADDLYRSFLEVALAVALDPGAPIYQWHAGTRSCAVIDAWERNGVLVHQQIIWTKARRVLTYADFMQQHEPCFYGWRRGERPPVERRPPVNEPTVWDHDQVGETGAGHPTQKPTALYRKPIEWHTQPGELIYEPFSGSGTALVSAEALGRRCVAIEVAPEFVDVSAARWQRLTGQLPVLEATGEPHDFLAEG